MHDAGHALEESTLRLINRFVHDEQSRSYLDRVREVTGLDLPASDMRLVASLYRTSTSVSEAAAGMGVDIAQVSRQAVRLADLGLVDRVQDAADRRRVLLSLAPATQELVDRWLRSWLTDYTAEVSTWPAEEIEVLRRWFRYIHDRLSLALPRAPRIEPDARGDAGPPPSIDDEVLRLALWIQRSRGFNDLLTGLGVPLTQYSYLTLRAVRVKGPLTIGDVAAEMGMDHSQASKRVSQLERVGLIVRSTDANDRRSSVVSISPEGRDLLDTVRATQLDGLTTLLAPIDTADRNVYEPLVQRYVETLQPAGQSVVDTY